MKFWNKLICQLHGHERRKCTATTHTHRLMTCQRCGDVQLRTVGKIKVPVPDILVELPK